MYNLNHRPKNNLGLVLLNVFKGSLLFPIISAIAFHELNPVLCRFGRDYYINDSRAAINDKGRRSTASTSSRPSSSMSQGSSSTGADQEQQVSFQLEKFEEASLRGSLSRWTYRDPYSSPNFAVNPLLRMELDGSNPASTDRAIEHSTESVTTKGNSICWDETIVDDEEQVSRRNIKQRYVNYFDESPRVHQDHPTTITTSLNLDTAEKVAYNPLYELSQSSPSFPKKLKLNRNSKDSGMYSIETDSQNLEDQKQEDDCKRLSSGDWPSDQILSSNGRRYWGYNGTKYHTFGGIKNPLRSINDSDEDNFENEINEPSNANVADFSKMKFQTFGGIKNSQAGGKGIPTYRKIKLRSPLKSRTTRRSKSPQSDSDSQNHRMTPEDFNLKSVSRSQWTDEEYTEENSSASNVSRFSNRCKMNNRRSLGVRSLGRREMIGSSSCRSSSEDNWQDDDSNVPDRTVMTKFLKDVSNEAKSRRSPSKSPSNFSNTSKRKLFEDSRRTGSSNRHRSDDDNESLKLEPPIVPQVVERTFESLRDIRVAEETRKFKSRESRRKRAAWSLNNVTIW